MRKTRIIDKLTNIVTIGDIRLSGDVGDYGLTRDRLQSIRIFGISIDNSPLRFPSDSPLGEINAVIEMTQKIHA